MRVAVLAATWAAPWAATGAVVLAAMRAAIEIALRRLLCLRVTDFSEFEAACSDNASVKMRFQLACCSQCLPLTCAVRKQDLR